MKNLLLASLSLLMIIAAHVEASALTCDEVEGARLYSQELEPQTVYLGFFGSASGADSINNPDGTYGSVISFLSVRNPFSNYGSQASSLSATWDQASSPPEIFKCGEVIGYLTTNPQITDGISLDTIDQCEFQSTIPSDDIDGDGFTCDVDCGDNDETVYPGAPEVCDGKDNDCDVRTSDGSSEANLGDPTTCGFGVCENTGEIVCSSGSLADTCSPESPVSETDATCDQMDDDCDGFVDEDCSRETVELFVTRFYEQCLNRLPDAEGFDSWVDSLIDGSLTGADVAWGFVFSQEFLDLDTTNEEYITVLYRAFFDRDPDSGGQSYWLSQLNSGVSREDVLDGFIMAQEFIDLCDSYGIVAFRFVEAFVTRFYEQCLNRPPDSAGLAYWVDGLLAGSLTGADVAWGFVFSPEFTSLNTTNEEYLTVLYRAFFDREPDSGGVAYWLDQFANGASREEVLNGFIYAQEFADLSAFYGITPF